MPGALGIRRWVTVTIGLAIMGAVLWLALRAG